MNKKSNKNILEICMSPDLGGLELYMAKAALFLDKECNLTTIINESSKLEPYLKDKISYEVLSKKSNIFMFTSAIKLAQLIDKKDIDLIHLHWTKDLPFVILAKIFSKKKPKIVQSRHMTMTRYKDDFYHNFLYKNVDLILPVTQQVKEQLIKFIPQKVRPKIELLYVGSDSVTIDDEFDLGTKSFKVGMVGRINKDKGQHLLIEAIAILREKSLNIDAFIVGHAMQESYLDTLKQSIEEKGVRENIHLLGFVTEPTSFYKACDVIVLASKKETFGLVLVEAMRVETAVVGANSGGVTEIIDDGETGLLFESQNAQSLANAIEKLYIDEALRIKVAQEGKKKSELMFSNEKQFPKLVEILSKEIEVC